MENVWYVPVFFVIQTNILHYIQNQDNDALRENLAKFAEQPVSLMVYSSKGQTVRQVSLTPSSKWGGQGLLGVSIRFCSFDRAAETVWHVLEINPGGPADLAGLRPYTDYIIGSDQMLHDADDLYSAVEVNDGKPIKLYVYSLETDTCREVILTPNSNWGGEGSLGCAIGYGYLHRIPINVVHPEEQQPNQQAQQLTNGSSQAPVAPPPTYSQSQTLSTSSATTIPTSAPVQPPAPLVPFQAPAPVPPPASSVEVTASAQVPPSSQPVASSTAAIAPPSTSMFTPPVVPTPPPVMAPIPVSSPSKDEMSSSTPQAANQSPIPTPAPVSQPKQQSPEAPAKHESPKAPATTGASLLMPMMAPTGSGVAMFNPGAVPVSSTPGVTMPTFPTPTSMNMNVPFFPPPPSTAGYVPPQLPSSSSGVPPPPTSYMNMFAGVRPPMPGQIPSFMPQAGSPAFVPPPFPGQGSPQQSQH